MLRIHITAKDTQRVVVDYQNRKGQASTNSTNQSKPGHPFSQEVFVDAIIEFIVADDQVRAETACNSLRTQWNMSVNQCNRESAIASIISDASQ